MRKAKFWLMQIVMLAIISLVFGSPVFAGPPAQAQGNGGDTSSTAHSNHSGGKAQAESHADDNAAFMTGDGEGGGDDGDDGTLPTTDPEPEPDSGGCEGCI